MTQMAARIYLIQSLLNEQSSYTDIPIPTNQQEQKNLLRSLFNIRMPNPISNDFLQMQNLYLQEEMS